MISVFPNKIVPFPVNTHEVVARQSLLDWFHADGLPAEVEPAVLPLSVFVNGERALPSQWASIEFGPEDRVEIYREPKGTDPFSITFALVFGAKAVLSSLMPKMPSLNSRNSSTKRGNDLGMATVKGNQVKLNSVIREIAGRQRPFPDYALPPNRYFDDPRSQWIEMLLVVGKGKFDIPVGGILIGDTPVISLGNDAEIRIYGPGADLSSEPVAKWWHSAPEVGATSTGTAGIELKATYAVTPVPTAKSYQFAGFTITVPSGAGQFPDGWAAGMIVRVEVPYPYAVIDGGAGRDIIRGNLDQIAPYVGMPIEITGANAGIYIVATYTPGVGTAPDEMTLDWEAGGPVTGLQIGSALQMGIGVKGLRYRITAANTATISVSRMNAVGETDTTWPGFDALTTSSASMQLDGSTQEGDWCGPFPACPAGTTTNRISWDIFFPQGLARVGSTGGLEGFNVTVEVQYRDIPTAGAWTSIKKVYSQKTLDQIGFTEFQDILRMRPEMRIRRVGAKSTSTSDANNVQWYGLRANLPAPTKYDGVTVIAMRVKGGNRIASQTESQVSCVATRILPTRRNGAWTADEPTRDIAAWIGYVAKSVGYSIEDGNSDIDLAELDRLQAIWTARGDTYDSTIESASTVKACMIEALQAGFAELTIDRGLIRPVRDEPRGPDFDHIYNPQVMTKPLKREAEHVTADDFDGVDVEYVDSITWQVETVECRLPGDLGLRTEKVKVEGVTDKTRAWRIGMRRRRMQVYQRKRYSFTTELDALNSGYLDYALLGDTTPGYGQSAMLKGYAPLGGQLMLVSSEAFDWSAGGEHWIALRRRDGSASGPYVATRIDDYRLTIPALDFTPVIDSAMDAPVLQFGPKAKFCYPALIKEVNPSGTVSCSVTAVNYDDRVYLDDDNFPPA